jgi:hypothetical protein
MDYRCTEAFAREMEAAALRAEGLLQEAIHAFWHAAAMRLRAAWGVLRRHLLRRSRIDTLYPEA